MSEGKRVVRQYPTEFKVDAVKHRQRRHSSLDFNPATFEKQQQRLTGYLKSGVSSMSIIIPEEPNYLLNPLHPKLRRNNPGRSRAVLV